MKYFLSFVIEDISFGTPIEEIREIARPKSVFLRNKTGVKHLIGYFSLRGSPVPLFDLPGHLALRHKDKNEVIIINYSGTTVGILVDRVLGIVATREVFPYSEIIPRHASLVGVVPRDGSLLQVISLVKLFTRPRIKKIEKFIALCTA
jgi:chemotaxis signal transduction protein